MMKKIYLAILSIAILGTSCMDNFLDTQSPSVPSDENLFESTALTKAALMGVYARMTDTYMYGQKLCVNWQGVSDVEAGSYAFKTSEYKAMNSDHAAENFYDNSYNNTTKWETLYNFVESATAVIDGIRKSSLLNSPEEKEEMRTYLGEALALNALGYFELIRYWGDVPFKTEAAKSDLSNVYEGKVDKDVIYKHIIADLQEAITYLPWIGEGSCTVERMNKGFAKGLLAKVALFAGGWSVRDSNIFPDLDLEHHPDIQEMGGYFVGRSKKWKEYYKLAATQCAEIISDPDNPHSLDPSFENIWKTVNHLDYNDYNENLFEVAFGEGQNGDIGSIAGYSLLRGVFGNGGMGGSGYAATTMYYFYSFNPADTRRDVTCAIQDYRNVEGKNKEVIACNPLGIPCGKWRWYWMNDYYMKVLFPQATSRIGTGINWILMRYSDILLMFAEAQNALTGPDVVNEKAKMSPRQALEKVRERAFGAGSSAITDYDSDFFTAIVNERAWEFACENIRRQDLSRWGLLDKKIEAMKEALCLMYDNTQPVNIFGKIYQPEDFPKKLYYKYKDQNNEEYIDLTSVNFYEDQGTSDPPIGYYSCNWVPMLIARDKNGDLNEEINKSYASTISNILVCGSGLNASYDYSSLFGKLRWGAEAQAEFIKYPVGNGVCNYRHLYAIYYEDIFESQGKLSNAYGFK